MTRCGEGESMADLFHRDAIGDSFVDGMAQKRLTYADLIAKPEGN